MTDLYNRLKGSSPDTIDAPPGGALNTRGQLYDVKTGQLTTPAKLAAKRSLQNDLDAAYAMALRVNQKIDKLALRLRLAEFDRTFWKRMTFITGVTMTWFALVDVALQAGWVR